MPQQITAKKLEQVESKKEGQEQFAAEFAANSDTNTRQHIARAFVRFYFGVMIVIIVGVPLYNYLIARAGMSNLALSLKDTLLTYSAVAGPTAGLVIAYYFKDKSS